MNLLIEEFDVAAGYTALKDNPNISTRLCVSVKPDTEILRFVRDTTSITVDGKTFDPVPYIQFTDVITGSGNIADTMDIVLDGLYLQDSAFGELTDILKRVVQYPLRGKPIQVARIVLNVDTYEAIALQPLFVGTIHNSPLKLSPEQGPNLTIKCASYRNAAHRQTAWTHGDVSHKQRWAGDNAAKFMSDAINRGGRYWWNKTQSGGSGGSSSGNPNNNTNTTLHQY